MTNPFKEIAKEPEEKAQSNPFLTTEEPSPISQAVGAIRENVVEPAKKVGNFTLDMLSYLDRPRNALALGARDMIQAETEGRMAGQPIDRPSVFLQGAERGLLGEDTYTTRNLIPQDVQEENPFLSGVAGFVGDVATDPLTYVGGIVGKGAKGIISGTVKGVEGVAPGLVDNALMRAFNIYRGDLMKIRELEGKYRDIAGAGKYQVIRESKDWNKKLNDLAVELDMPPEQLKASIVRQVESPSPEAPLKIAQQAADIRTKNASQIALEQQLGIKIDEVENYFPHVATPEALRAIGKERVLDIFRKSETQHASTKARKLGGTVEDINAQKILGTDKFFTDDPVVAQAVRDLRHANAVGAAQFLDDASRQFGMDAAKAPAHYIDSNIPLLKGKKFDPEVARYLDKNYAKFGSTEEVVGFLDMYDQAQNWWKMWSLGARPAYHTRNAVGNVWNNYIAGVKNPAVYLQAGQLEFMEQTGKFTGKIANKPTFEIYDAALKHGVLGRSQYHGDIVDNVIHEVNKSLTGVKAGDFFTPTTRNIFLRGGFAGGRKIEENARLAHFIDRVRKGDSYEDAAKSVKKYLFDYEDLSPVEQKIFKRVMPFYTWTRKNIPLQMEALVENPQRFNRINLIKNQIQGEVPDEESVSEQIKEQGPIYVGDTPEGDKKAFTLKGYLPFMDIQALANPQESALGLLSPFIKETLEQMVPGNPRIGSGGYDTFRKEAIQKWKGHTVDFLGVKMPARLAHLARNIVMLNELDRANPFNVFGQNQIDPVTGERIQSRSFGMEEEVGIGQFGIGTTRESRQDMNGIDRLLQYSTGLKPIGVDEEFGKAMYSMGLKKDVDELRLHMRRAKRLKREREAESVEQAIDGLFGDIQERISE